MNGNNLNFAMLLQRSPCLKKHYGRLNKATINVDDAGLNLEQLNITGEMGLKVKHSTTPDYTSLVTEPGEVEDIFLVFHYKITES